LTNSSNKPLELFKPSRKLLMEGPLEQISKGKRKERYLVLCNDMLLVCKPLAFTKGRFALKQRIPAGLFLVNDSSTEG